ncbi:FkbM family methyltransferase [Streptomyces sp. NPDC085481]|uniref:FkbM family methyltransferase n=1 Tax=Streptomyces sp. NPDC085481 TaxID=3365727 RepID=UPI0037D1854D
MTSQYGQDLFVVRALNGLRGGFFLDSGASDGVDASNTHLLETSYDWSGICVEPNPRFFTELVRNRRCHSVNCCLYDRAGEVDFVEAGTVGGILDEYHPVLLDCARRLLGTVPDRPPPTVRRPARTIRSVLREFGAPSVLDYWSLDTEGSELALLRSFPFDEYDVRVLTVEHNWLPARSAVRDFLEGQGYLWAGELGCDDCFVRPSPVTATGPAWRSAAWRHRRLA